MYHKHNTEGVVLSGRTDGEHNRYIYVFTKHVGLIRAKVQGARNLSSKLRSGSQDFTYGNFSFVHGKSGWKLVGAKSELNIFELFRNDKEKLFVFTNILNLIKKLVGEEEQNEKLFDLIKESIFFLIDAKKEVVASFECLVLLRILHNLGYMRQDPDFSVSLTDTFIKVEDLETLIPRRNFAISLINEALKATQI